MAYNSKAFNNFDAVQAINTYQFNELDLINKSLTLKSDLLNQNMLLELNNLNVDKKIINCSYLEYKLL